MLLKFETVKNVLNKTITQDTFAVLHRLGIDINLN